MTISTKLMKNTDSRQTKGFKEKRIFSDGDIVWIHLRNGRFPTKRKHKLLPRADGPFRVICKVNDNAYNVDLYLSMVFQTHSTVET